jgi:DNA-binding LacI/PurR family transcriptional regulator
MTARVKIGDIAKACGVSNGTVSLALNDSHLVNDETKKLVKQTADKMGYIPNEMARSLVKKRSRQIGVIVPDIMNTFYATFISELNKSIQAKGYTLSIYISNNSPQKENEIVDQMLRNNIEGIIIVPVNEGETSAEYVKRLSSLNIPFLFAVDRYEGTDAICVMSDCGQGMYNMIKYLTKKEYMDIAFLSGDISVATLRARLDGYTKAINENGLEKKVIPVHSIDYDGAKEATQKCIDEGNLPRAFVCPNDMMALGVINTLKSNKISVPEECAVTGFDNVIFSEISSVPITTMHQDIGLIAQKSTEIILDLIDGKETDRTDHLIKTELIERSSC